jgi:hypothetical protein
MMTPDDGTEDHNPWISGGYKKGGTVCSVSKSFIYYRIKESAMKRQ